MSSHDSDISENIDDMSSHDSDIPEPCNLCLASKEVEEIFNKYNIRFKFVEECLIENYQDDDDFRYEICHNPDKIEGHKKEKKRLRKIHRKNMKLGKKSCGVLTYCDECYKNRNKNNNI